MSYPLTWYAADAGETDAFPAVLGSVQADVCVVGGGLAGLMVAHQLLNAGKTVALLEAKRIAWGASGRNGGFVLPGFAIGVEAIIAKVGLAAAKELYQLSADGHELVRATIADLVPEAKMGDGWIVATRHPGPDRLRGHRDLMADAFGRPSELWEVEQTRTVLKSQRYHEALFDPGAMHIQPLKFAQGLARDIARRGGLLFERSPALGWEKKGRAGFQVRTQLGSVRAAHIVFCTSGYDTGLFAPLSRAVLPVATYIAVTEPLGERVEGAIATASAVSDTRRAGDYYRRLPQGRILWGGRMSTRRSQPADLATTLKSDLLAVYPQLGDPRIDFAWGGLMGYARHAMPIVGPAGRNLWIASAFGGHGLNTTAMAGALIAGAIARNDDRWKLFAGLGAPWAGGPLGQAAVQARYWSMQLKDRWDERKALKRRSQKP